MWRKNIVDLKGIEMILLQWWAGHSSIFASMAFPCTRYKDSSHQCCCSGYIRTKNSVKNSFLDRITIKCMADVLDRTSLASTDHPQVWLFVAGVILWTMSPLAWHWTMVSVELARYATTPARIQSQIIKSQRPLICAMLRAVGCLL